MSQKRILLIEDNEFNRKIVRDLLARQPYDLLEANDGEAGVAAARRDRPDQVHVGESHREGPPVQLAPDVHAGHRQHGQDGEQPPGREEPDHLVVPLVRACRAAATNLTISSSQSESVRNLRWAAPAPRIAVATAVRWAAAAAE